MKKIYIKILSILLLSLLFYCSISINVTASSTNLIPISKVVVSKIPTQYYTGNNINVSPVLKYNNTQLKSGKDYDIISYKPTVNVYGNGTGSILIKMKGTFTGTKKITYNIENMGNELARTACRLSYSRPSYHANGFDGTSAMLAASLRFSYANPDFLHNENNKSILIFNDTDPNFRGSTTIKNAEFEKNLSLQEKVLTRVRHGGAAIAIIFRESGYDMEFKGGQTQHTNQKYLQQTLDYLNTKNYQWVKLGKYIPGGKYLKSDNSQENLLPGDIVVRNNFVSMYVGSEIPLEIYNNYLKGTDADRGKPTSDSCWVTAHHSLGFMKNNNSSACIGNEKYANPNDASAYVYRCIIPDNKNMSKITIDPIPKQYYTGNKIEVTPVVKLNNKKLTAGSDYEIVSCKNDIDNYGNGFGTIIIKIKMKGLYQGTRKATFFIIENMGNELARTACKLSYSQPAYHGDGCDGTNAMLTASIKFSYLNPDYLHNENNKSILIFNDADKTNAKFEKSLSIKEKVLTRVRHCGAAIAIICRESGYDMEFKGGQTQHTTEHKYLQPILDYVDTGKNPNCQWVKIGKYIHNSNGLYENNGKQGHLLPGDIVLNPSHICMYVGNKIPLEIYEKYLRGTGEEDADKGKPTSESCWVSAHHNLGFMRDYNSSACIGDEDFAISKYNLDKTYVYRCIRPDNLNTK